MYFRQSQPKTPCPEHVILVKVILNIPSENPQKNQRTQQKILPQARHKDEETAPHN